MSYSSNLCCQHQHGSPLSAALRFFSFAIIFCLIQQPQNVRGETPTENEARHQIELDIQEMHNIASRLNYSINTEKYACDNYYDYVCSRNRPLFSVLGKKVLDC